MNTLDLLLVGGLVGLLLGVMILGGRPQVVAPLYVDERRPGGCAEVFVALLLVGLLLLALMGAPASGG